MVRRLVRSGASRVLIVAAATLLLTGCGSGPAAETHHGGGASADHSGVSAPATPAAGQAGIQGGDGSVTGAAAAATPPAGRGASAPAGARPPRATPLATLPPNAQATPESAGGRADLTSPSAGAFTITGSTCHQGGGSAAFFFGTTGSGEEVEISIQDSYAGPGTYGAGARAAVSVAHANRLWYGQFQEDPGAVLTVDAGGASGSFSFPTELDASKETVRGRFACG